MPFSGSRAQAHPGATCPRRQASGHPFTGSSYGGHALWDVLLEVLAESRTAPDTLQMIDSTIVRAHQHAAGGKGGLVATLWAVRAVASRPRSTSGPMRKGLGSALS